MLLGPQLGCIPALKRGVSRSVPFSKDSKEETCTQRGRLRTARAPRMSLGDCTRTNPNPKNDSEHHKQRAEILYRCCHTPWGFDMKHSAEG